jgi:hypothetical protein
MSLKVTIMKALHATIRTALAMLFSDLLLVANLRKAVLVLSILMLWAGSISAQSNIQIDPSNFVTQVGEMKGGELWKVGLPINACPGLIGMRGQISIEISDKRSVTWISSFDNMSISWVPSGTLNSYHVQFECTARNSLVNSDTAWIGFILDEGLSLEETLAMLDGIVTADVIEFGCNLPVGIAGQLPPGSLLPVPAATYIKLRQPTDEVLIEAIIFNASGEIVRRIVPDGYETQIDLDGLPDGMYYLQCRGVDGSLHRGSFLKKE